MAKGYWRTLAYYVSLSTPHRRWYVCMFVCVYLLSSVIISGGVASEAAQFFGCLKLISAKVTLRVQS